MEEPENKKTAGRPLKSDDDKVHNRTISLTNDEFNYLVENFGSLTKAIRTLIPPQGKSFSQN